MFGVRVQDVRSMGNDVNPDGACGGVVDEPDELGVLAVDGAPGVGQAGS